MTSPGPAGEEMAGVEKCQHLVLRKRRKWVPSYTDANDLQSKTTISKANGY